MKAGFGKENITPRVGVELYGFGPYRNRYSIGVRDILEARSVALEQNGKKIVIIGCDLCTLQDVTVARIRELIRREHPELSDADIMVNCNHTHSGPATIFANTGWGVTDPPWFTILPYKIARAACSALDSLQEVAVRHAYVPCRHIGLNRVKDVDAPPLEDVLKEDWEPAKPELTDTMCRVIRFDSVSDGKLAGFIAYFGCHPVVCSESTRFIHGDFTAVAMHQLMRENPGSVGVFLQGALGDVNSGCVHKPEQESLLALDVFAARFANAVRNGLNQAEEITIDSIASVSQKFAFSTKQVFTGELLSQLQEKYEDIICNPDADEQTYAVRMAAVYLRGIEQIRKLLAENKKDINAELHIIRIGDIQLMGAPFEIMQAIKNDIASGASAKYPMVMSHTNGAFGYAPDNDSLKGTNGVVSEKGNYESVKVPLIAGRLPYADIHDELVRYMKELEAQL